MPIPEPQSDRTAYGGLGGWLAAWGAIAFAALSPVSYAGAQIACGASLLGLLLAFATGRLRYRPTPLDLPLLLFVGAELLSIVFSVHPARSLRCLRGDWILLFYPVFSQSLRRSRDVRRSFNALLVTSSIVASYSLWQMFTGKDLLRHRPLEPIGHWFIATGLFGHHLTYGGHVLITATAALALLVGARGAPAIALRTGSLALQLCGMLASFARTAWVGLIGGIAGMALAARGSARRLAVGLLSLLAAAAIALLPIRARLSSVLALHDEPRIRLWRTAIRIWKDHPIFGAGLGSFKTLFPIYKVPGTYMATGHPHNDALNILVHSGILGLMTFAFIWVRYFRFVGGTRRHVSPQDPRNPLLLAGVLVPIAFFVGAMGQCFLTDEEVGTLFWFVVASSVAVAREVRDDRV